MMAWAKLHTDILGDPKLMRAARKGMAGLVLLPWLIVAAKHADDDGRLTVGGHAMEADDLVPMIPGATPAEVMIALANLTELGVLVAENGVLRFAAWHPRQSKPSDSNEAWRERQQRSRARRKTEAKHDTSEPVTPPPSENVTPRHATVTPRGHAIEAEGEVEEKKSTSADAAVPRAGARATAPTPRAPAPPDLLTWLPPEYADDLTAAIRSTRRPEAFVADLRKLRDRWPEFGLASCTGIEVGRALRDAAIKGIPLSGTTLANCVRVVQRAPPVVVGSIEQAVADHDREREARRARYAAGNE